MKTLFLLALLAAPAQPNTTSTLDSLNTRVTILTSSTDVVVQDSNYAAPGHYFIGGTPGSVPFTAGAHGFTIADPQLAKVIDFRTEKVVITFLSTTTVNKHQLPVSITIDAMSQRAPKN
jgi:hypothetical protein